VVGREPKMERAQNGAAPSAALVATVIQDLDGCRTAIRRKLTVQEAADHLGLSISWLNKTRTYGDGPPYLKIGRRVVYDIYNLETWAGRTRRRHTSE
jgi:Helix-turn-helix domain